MALRRRKHKHEDGFPHRRGKFEESKHRRQQGRFAEKPGSEKAKPKAEGHKTSGVGPDDEITILAKSNPKKAGSNAHTSFSQYKEGMTVQQYVDGHHQGKKEALSNLAYDQKKGYIAFKDKGGKKTLLKSKSGMETESSKAVTKATQDNAPGTPRFVTVKQPEFKDDPERWANAPGVRKWTQHGAYGLGEHELLMEAHTASGLKFKAAMHDSSVSFYTGSGYSYMNEALRKGADPTKISTSNHVASLDKSIAGSTFESDMIMYRGMGYSDLNNMPPPEHFADLGFASLSYNPGVSHGFSGYGSNGNKTLTRVRVPKGYTGLSVGMSDRNTPAKAMQSEAEVILPRGTKFKFVSRSTVSAYGKQLDVIDLEIIPSASLPSAPPKVSSEAVPFPSRARTYASGPGKIPGWSR